MFHFQTPTRDWPRAVAMLPAGFVIKAIDNVQMLAEAKAHNPGIKTILRHHYGAQVPGHLDSSNEQRARDFFDTFIDGTFREGSTAGRNHAESVDYIEGWNEYFAHSQNDIERKSFISWARAAAKVWREEYRSDPKLAHIKLILANTAVGNDIPIEVARAAQQYDALLGYHPYWPVSHNHVPPDEWLWYSGRWVAMDDAYRAEGVTVRWAFTEAGAVGYRGDYPNIGLLPNNGWRLDDVHGRNVDEYLKTITRWMNLWHSWNDLHHHRALPPVLFNSGGGRDWKHFEIEQPEMDRIAEFVAHWQPQEPEPPPQPPPPPPTTTTYTVAIFAGDKRQWAVDNGATFAETVTLAAE